MMHGKTALLTNNNKKFEYIILTKDIIPGIITKASPEVFKKIDEASEYAKKFNIKDYVIINSFYFNEIVEFNLWPEQRKG
jgi:hypothetical protein